MKELSIEEKAKRYDEALEIIIDYYQKIKYSSLSNASTDREVLEKAFPQLKESEGEKERKEILDYIIKGSESCYDVQQYGKERFEKWIAWLEKQGKWNTDNSIWHKVEPNEYVLEKTLICKENGEIDLVEDTILSVTDAKYALPVSFLGIPKSLKKQGEQNPNPCDGCINRKGCINCENGELRETEQKPAWSDEDEQNLRVVVDYLIADNGLTLVIINWLKSLKDKVQPQKQEWSEYDEQMLEAVLYDGENALGERHKEWLKGLKYRVQPRQEWNGTEIASPIDSDVCG